MKSNLNTVISGLAAVLCLFACAPVQMHANPCMKITLGADYLYWKPSVDVLDVAAKVDSIPGYVDVDYDAVHPDWEQGYRVYLGAEDVCRGLDLYASFTYLDSNTRSRTHQSYSDEGERGVTSPVIHPDVFIEGLFEEVKGWLHFTYQEWDLLCGYEVCPSACHTFVPYFGVAGLYFQQELDVDYFTDSFWYNTHWDGNYWGVGLRAGAAYDFRLNDCFKLFAFANGTILAGKGEGHNRQTVEGLLNANDNDCCRCVPGYHLGVGFSADFTCWCTEIGLRIGYEFVQWWNLPNQRTFLGAEGEINQISHSTSSGLRDLGFNGLFAGAVIRF